MAELRTKNQRESDLIHARIEGVVTVDGTNFRNNLVWNSAMPQANNAKNDECAQQERRQRVASMYLSGKTQHEIARVLDCSQGTVCKDLTAIRKAWLASALRDFDAKQSEELAKLDRLEAVAWEAWARSCEDARTKQKDIHAVRVVPGRGENMLGPGVMVPMKTTTRMTRKGQVGDPRFLDQVRECVMLRLKIMGALKSDQTTTVVQTAQINWDLLAGIGNGGVPDEVENQIRKVIEALPAPGTNGEPRDG